MCFGGGASSANKIAKQQRADEVAREARIKSGMGQIATAFAPFNDDYYAKQQQNYVDYAEPQLDTQLANQRKNLIYALARTGNLDSSAANKESNDLTQAGDQQKIAIQNQGLDYANTDRQNVENARSDIVSQLNATGDDTAAAQAAVRQAQNLGMPQGYSALGNMFADFANQVATIGSNSNNAYRGFVPTSAPLFGSSGSSRVVS